MRRVRTGKEHQFHEKNLPLLTLPKNMSKSFGASTIKKLQDLQAETNKYMNKVNCQLYPTKAVLVRNEIFKGSHGDIVKQLINFKKELQAQRICSNNDIEKLCENFYANEVAEFDNKLSKIGLSSSDELFKIHQQNYRKGGIYSNSF